MSIKLSAVSAAILLTVSLPAFSFAEIKSIDGLTAEKQFLATTSDATSMHMKIVNGAGKNHVFSWDNTAWTVAQGGTGATAFTPGSVVFMSSSTLSQNNASFFWDTINAALNLGVNGAQSLVARLTVKGASGQAIANFVSSSGMSELFVAATGYVGIGTTNPLHALDVVGAMYSRLVDNGTSATIDWNAGNVQKVSLTSDASFIFNNARAGGEYKLIFTQDAVGGHAVSWPANVKWSHNVTPALNTVADGASLASFVYDGVSYFGTGVISYAESPATPSLLSPTSGSSFNTVISDTSYSVFVCDPNHTCDMIDFLGGFSDNCAVSGFTDLALNGGKIGPGYYNDESLQHASPCDETIPGAWKVRQYLYSGGTFKWIGPVQVFTVVSPAM